jgi:fatty-acyl-CoA synthase
VQEACRRGPPLDRGARIAGAFARTTGFAEIVGMDLAVGESANKGWLRALKLAAAAEAAPERTLSALVAEQAARFGTAPALISRSETLSYEALGRRANRWARWALAVGLGKGETVALIMPNRPEYVAVWLGITSVGGVVALINTGLRGPSLAHCLALAGARHVIDADTLPGVEATLASLDDAPLTPDERRGTNLSDLALLIYTSGTTGLPKAARVSHRRVMAWSHWFSGLMDAGPADRLYNCLPMFHSVGGVVAVGALLVGGGSVAIAERFSASRFWDDVAAFDCTLFQYIGELCRYLVNAPPHPLERGHKLRLACGNGLGAEVWPAFQDRFAIPRILEFYAATEGNFSLYNLEGEPGALGRIPAFLAHRFPVAIVRFDADRGQPARGADGRCIRCPAGGAGEAIARISATAGEAGGRFEGYTDAAETDGKILRDVFAPGDAWVRSGDLMAQDARGFYRFVDRIGDTFRWKGENVATTEVAAALGAYPGVEAACVYGVKVPGADGRAGMAALVCGQGFDLAGLPRHLETRLPTYARPLFLRLAASLEATETFKPRKAALTEEGFDPAAIADPLFVFDDRAGAYVRLDADRYAAIAARACAPIAAMAALA